MSFFDMFKPKVDVQSSSSSSSPPTSFSHFEMIEEKDSNSSSSSEVIISSDDLTTSLLTPDVKATTTTTPPPAAEVTPPPPEPIIIPSFKMPTSNKKVFFCPSRAEPTMNFTFSEIAKMVKYADLLIQNIYHDPAGWEKVDQIITSLSLYDWMEFFGLAIGTNNVKLCQHILPSFHKSAPVVPYPSTARYLLPRDIHYLNRISQTMYEKPFLSAVFSFHSVGDLVVKKIKLNVQMLDWLFHHHIGFLSGHEKSDIALITLEQWILFRKQDGLHATITKCWYKWLMRCVLFISQSTKTNTDTDAVFHLAQTAIHSLQDEKNSLSLSCIVHFLQEIPLLKKNQLIWKLISNETDNTPEMIQIVKKLKFVIVENVDDDDDDDDV